MMMRILEKRIGNIDKEILEVNIYDEEDIAIIKNNYADYEDIEIGLGMLGFLQLFSNLKTLIITEGIPEKRGLEYLYKHKELEMLVLEYEETDSDEEGIDIAQFPQIKYVLSRSNLNITDNAIIESNNRGIQIEILNYYKNGKPVKVTTNPMTNICSRNNFLFFSTESKEPASVIIMRMLNTLEKEFQKEFSKTCFSKQLDRIAIIPICMPDNMLEQGFGKEKKYVSIKRKYADIRLRISYEEFWQENKREKLVKENIKKAAKYVAQRDVTFELEAFLKAINTACKNGNI